MAEGINVGSVEATVVPDARNFNRDLSAQIGPAGDRAGKQIADALSKGIRDGIRDGLSNPASIAPAGSQGTKAGDAFGAAFKNRVKAALAALPSAEVKLDDEAAQAKLDFLRDELTSLSSKKIGVDISDTDAIARLTALRAEMDNLAARSASIQVKADTSVASAQLDKFFAEAGIKAQAAGDDEGKKLTTSAATSVTRGSPLIIAAVAGGLVAGGPAVLAASTLLFGGIAAGVAAQDPGVKAAFHHLLATVEDTINADAAGIAPVFEEVAAHAGAAFNRVAPEIHQALAAVAPDVLSITDALEGMTETAMPAFVRVVQDAAPIVSGLDTFIRDLGTGVAGFLDDIDQHGGAAGTVLSSIGQIIGQLLPTLGTLIGEGAELGSAVLPPIAAALHLVEAGLNVIAPVLPEVVAGFVALKATQGVESLLSTAGSALVKISSSLPAGLGAQISGIGSALGGVAKAEGEAAAGAALLGPVGLAVAGIAAAFVFLSQESAKAKAAQDQVTASLVRLMQAQAEGGAAGDAAAAKLNNYKDTIADLQHKLDATQQSTVTGAKGMDQYGGSVTAQGAKIDVLKSQLAEANAKYSEQQAVLGPLNGTAQTAAAMQESVSNALKAVQSAAGAANTQIDLLKTALDQLTGKTVTADQAQIAITQAVQAATTATQGQTGALIDANGQINLNTQAGAAAAQSLINLAGTQHNEIAVLEQQGASSDVVKQKSDDLRNQFIRTAEQMGFTANQAQHLADKYYGIPGQVNTEINADTAPATNAIDNVLKRYASVSYNGTNITVGAGATRIIANAEGNLLPMSATTASIVRPGTQRIIGDNPVADEAFIPINDSPRSHAIFNETASRMGYDVLPMANGGILVDQGSVIVHAGQSLLDQIDAKAKAAMVDPGWTMDPNVEPGTGMVAALNWAKTQVGKPYIWGGVGPAGYDCSGFMSAITNVIRGRSPYSRVGSTASFPWAGFTPGYGQFTIGSTQNAGGGIGHMAGTLLGVNVESTGNHVRVGGDARGASNSLFGTRDYLVRDMGGLLPPGPSLVYNGTGDHELVAPKQTFEQVMSDAAAAPGSGPVTLQLDAQATHDLLEGRAVAVVADALSTVRNHMVYSG